MPIPIRQPSSIFSARAWVVPKGVEPTWAGFGFVCICNIDKDVGNVYDGDVELGICDDLHGDVD